jgi:hypothetical protein
MIYISTSWPRSVDVRDRDEDLTTYRLKGLMVSGMSISAMVGAMRAGSLQD